MNYEMMSLSDLDKEAFLSDNKLAQAILKHLDFLVADRFENVKDAVKSVYVHDALPSIDSNDMEPAVAYQCAAEVLDYFMNTDPDVLFPVYGKMDGGRYMICPAFNESNHVHNHHVQLNEVGNSVWKLMVHHSDYGESYKEVRFEAKTIVTARKKAVEIIHQMMIKDGVMLIID